MKKVILSVAVIAAASFTSCKKDRICTCTGTTVTTTTMTIGGKTTTDTKTTSDSQIITFTKARKGDAKSACSSFKKTDSEDPSPSMHIDYESTVECSVK
ncbi:MAG TPA: hypothetical protein VFF27_09220 [Bacteroidia bacterium]|jgi:hypothetical protein|nr:hypothetical protein [Bacteroidia bacterium]